MEGGYALTLEDVLEAEIRIRDYVHRTPVFTCSTIDAIADRKLYFKCEVFQKGGAFKIRGACNAILSLSEDQAKAGVVTHSSGNHAAAVALAARLRGIPANIIVPQDAPQCKVDAIMTYGGTVHFCRPTLIDRERLANEVQQQTGAVFVHPYNDPRVMAGQGTMGLEFLSQVSEGLDCLIIPVSGGGMLSGVTTAAKGLAPNIKIIAAEPVGTNNIADAALCKAEGKLHPKEKTLTIADGLQAQLGSHTWPIVRDLVDDIVTVSEQQIVEAMRLCFERMKVVVEPSGAVGLAAALSPQFKDNPKWSDLKRVGIILCGGNINLVGKGFWNMWST